VTASSRFGYAEEEDERTLEEYIDELDSWRNELVERAVLGLPRLCIDNGHGNVAVKVQNLRIHHRISRAE
jgi:hypothetical protein